MLSAGSRQGFSTLRFSACKGVPGAQETWQVHTLQNIVNYAARHHYNLSFSRPVDAHRAPAWNKVKAWEALLHEHDWVWQSDQDMLVMNLHQRLETFVDNSYDIVVGRDCVVFN